MGFQKPQLQSLMPHGCQLYKPWRVRMMNKSFYLVRAAQLNNLFVSRQKLRSKAVAYVDAERKWSSLLLIKIQFIWKTAAHLPEWPVDRSFMGSRSPRRHLGSGLGSGDHSADVQSQTN